MQTRQRKKIKVWYTVIFLMLIAAFMTGCGSKNTLPNGTDMGKALSWTYDIMGVRYKLYENGYAEIDTILNPHCQLTDTVTYEGKEYAVVKILNHSDGMVAYGIPTIFRTYLRICLNSPMATTMQIHQALRFTSGRIW